MVCAGAFGQFAGKTVTIRFAQQKARNPVLDDLGHNSNRRGNLNQTAGSRLDANQRAAFRMRSTDLHISAATKNGHLFEAQKILRIQKLYAGVRGVQNPARRFHNPARVRSSNSSRETTPTARKDA